tara:strand:- start:1632 stop:1814 length:183 start_codon:yes stop_codon:yes gene_type:complete
MSIILNRARKRIVEVIIQTIVLPNMGWTGDGDEANEARIEIGEAMEAMLQDIDSHYQPHD